MRQNGADVEFVPFTPASSDLHYRDPNYYKQMLDVIYELEKVRLSQMFNRVFSGQIDGSCDRQMLDHKFVSGRMANSDGSVTSVFIVVHSPEKNGAPGLLEAVNKALDLTGGKDTKLVGVTTDGESANTGRHGGLWRLLADQVQRGLATFWCAAHRSDLAIESVVSTIPELDIWKSNLLGLVRFFRTPRRMKMLSAQAGNVKQFPRHHDVRFAQHELQLVDAVLNNLPACIKVWEQMQAPESTSDRKEKAEAKGFLRIWNHQQKWITYAEQWENTMNVPFLPDGCDLGCKMTVRLRQLLPVTTGSVQKVLASLACMSPHSMQTERIVSHHNLVVDNHRTSMGEDTRNARLMVALNGVGTAYFDPRPAVVKFLEKTRRCGAPDWDIYGQREFVRKFTRETGLV